MTTMLAAVWYLIDVNLFVQISLEKCGCWTILEYLSQGKVFFFFVGRKEQVEIKCFELLELEDVRDQYN